MPREIEIDRSKYWASKIINYSPDALLKIERDFFYKAMTKAGPYADHMKGGFDHTPYNIARFTA